MCLVISAIFITPASCWAFWLDYHKAITVNGLPFLRDGIKKEIVDGNLNQDSSTLVVGGPANIAKNHFDACALRESSSNIQGKYNKVMRQTIDTSNYPFRAAWTFGELLHTVQDFYSHSNWAEISRSIWASTDKLGIVDRGLGMWKTINSWQVLTGKVVPIEVSYTIPGLDQAQPPKSGWSVQKISPQRGYFSDPLPEVKDPQGNKYVGLITHGREVYRLGDNCPDAVEGWNHEQLNKDGPTRGNYVGQEYKANHDRAVNLAVDQTAHEWCRYLNLLKSNPTYGYSAISTVMGLWVDKNKTPHPTGTACHEKVIGDKSVLVSIDSIKVINDLDKGSNPGDLTLALVLYKGDLKRSVRTEVGPIMVESGSYWPMNKLLQSLTMCLKPSDTLIATVQGWDDENKGEYYAKFNKDIYEYDYSSGFSTLVAEADQTLRGVTYLASGPAFGEGTHKVTSANIEVTFKISRMPYCIPEGVTSLSTDSDKDGVVDSKDNCDSVKNPDQKDTDNDRIGDACDLDLKDTDNDGVVDSRDNCDFVANPGQGNVNGDEFGDACQPGDQDNDGVVDAIDNCRWVANPDQKDEDKNGVGDACKDVIL